MALVSFYFFSLVAVVSGVLVIFARNAVHSVLWLILAFFSAAGLFVLGARRGGIAEFIAEDGDGELVEPGDVAAWTRAIEGLAAHAVRRGAPAPVRTMSDVAADMADLYAAL